MPVFGVIREILKNNDRIRSLNFYLYLPHDNVSDLTQNIPFIRLLHHDSPDGKEIEISREGILIINEISLIIDGLGQGEALALTSKVTIDEKHIFQIPMMDFCYKKDKEQLLADIIYFLKSIGIKGAVLESGRSFHFYGIHLMDTVRWRNFLGDCLLSGLVDTRFIGHNLKDGYSTLRISSCPPLRPTVPRVVSLI